MQLIHTIRHADIDLESGKFLNRAATRAIVMDGDDILLLYTRRYDDFSFPGGGVDHVEDLETALRRELQEISSSAGIRAPPRRPAAAH